jgi:hypothetical protein
MSLDPQPNDATRIEEPALVETLTLELQLVVAFEVLHRLDMAEKSRSLFTEELDLIEFLVTQDALLRSSLAVEVACEAAIAESLTPTLVAREVVDSKADFIVSPAHSLAIMDALVVIIRSSTTPAAAFVLQATGIGESFKAKTPDLAASKVCPKGATLCVPVGVLS